MYIACLCSDFPGRRRARSVLALELLRQLLLTPGLVDQSLTDFTVAVGIVGGALPQFTDAYYVAVDRLGGGMSG